MAQTHAPKKENDKWGLLVDEPNEFEGHFVGKVITYMELHRMVNELFSPVFEDFYGSRVINTGGDLRVNLAFEDSGRTSDTKIKNLRLTTLSGNVGDNNLARIARINKSSDIGPAYKVTEETIDLIRPLWGRYTVVVNNQVFDSQATEKNSIHEQLTNTGLYGFGGRRVQVIISNLDLNLLIAAYYGENICKNPRDREYDYRVTLGAHNPQTGDPIPIIQKFKMSDTDIVLNKAGYIPASVDAFVTV